MALYKTRLNGEWAGLDSVLDEELSSLPAEFRAPLVMCCLNQVTPAEAARKLRLTAASITLRLYLALEGLRKQLARRGFEISSETLAQLLSQMASGVVVPPKLVDSTVEMAVMTVSHSNADRADCRDR
jgi:RNA polymerase sigma-70 factor (ECF subfamily)